MVDDVFAAFPCPASIPDPEVEPQPRAELFATLARIDGWGPGAWRELACMWRITGGLLTLTERETNGDDDGAVDAVLVVPQHALLRRHDQVTATATADWVLRHAWRELLPGLGLRASVLAPAANVRATTACWFTPAGALVLRFHLWWPFAGMCCDGKRFAIGVRRLERFLRTLLRPSRALAQHVLTVLRQEAMRAALPAHGLVAFMAEGARIARASDDTPALEGQPLQVPESLAVTLDLGRWGRVRGLGIRQGITAIAGAPYHGKSTMLAALAAGRDNHPPGDGRELVVADPTVLRVQAEDGRRIKDTDLSAFFPSLPGQDSAAFATERASGATSMAASIVQGLAVGCRLFLIDEDTAAGNFLHLDPGMRRLLGRDLADHRTVTDALPTLAAQGVSVVLVAGAHLASLAAAEQVLIMRHFQPQDGTRAARRCLRERVAHRTSSRQTIVPMMPIVRERIIQDEPNVMLGRRHFLDIDAAEPERPRIADLVLDLRRSGWHLDAPVVRGALAAAAWCCRLAQDGCTLGELERRYGELLATRGLRAVDPFDTLFIAEPPWMLVLAVLERLPRPWMRDQQG